jgi:hypothetical protein
VVSFRLASTRADALFGSPALLPRTLPSAPTPVLTRSTIRQHPKGSSEPDGNPELSRWTIAYTRHAVAHLVLARAGYPVLVSGPNCLERQPELSLACTLAHNN